MDRTIGAQLIEPQKPIYTRSGWPIPQVAKLPQDVRLVANRSNEWKSWKPNVVLRSISPYPYNCVGLVFASRRAYIEIQHIYDILRNDYYHKVERNSVMSGDVVLYKLFGELTHVGLIIQAIPLHSTSTALDITVLSKWGEDGEFIHRIEDVPQPYGTAEEFWTERVVNESQRLIR